MGPGDPPRDGQSESGAALARSRFVDTKESVEDPILVSRRNAGAGVADGDGVLRPGKMRLELHPPAGGRELDYVVKKIEQHAADQFRIAAHGHRSRNCIRLIYTFLHSEG